MRCHCPQCGLFALSFHSPDTHIFRSHGASQHQKTIKIAYRFEFLPITLLGPSTNTGHISQPPEQSASTYLRVNMEFFESYTYHDKARSSDEGEVENDVSLSHKPRRTIRSIKDRGDEETSLLYSYFYFNIHADVMLPFSQFYDTPLIYLLSHGSFLNILVVLDPLPTKVFKKKFSQRRRPVSLNRI